METVTTRLCIVGGGPAGMMAGLLLARAGIDGHGAGEARRLPARLPRRHGPPVDPASSWTSSACSSAFLHAPARERVEHSSGVDRRTQLPDRRFQPAADRATVHRLHAAMGFPRLSRRARRARCPASAAACSAEATGLIEADGRVAGVRAERRRTASRSAPICASAPTAGTRRCATAPGFAVEDLGAPIDVLWFRLSRDRPAIRRQRLGRIEPGRIIVTIDRGDYWQCAFVIRKGGADGAAGGGHRRLPRPRSARVAPFLADRDRRARRLGRRQAAHRHGRPAGRWYRPGLLCIGDAAHAMSPVGGVGINLAIQDAVAAANLLAEPLRRGQRHRGRPRRGAGAPDVADAGDAGAAGAIQNNVLGRCWRPTRRCTRRCRCGSSTRCRRCSGLPARLIGMGVRPEHVRSPARA